MSGRADIIALAQTLGLASTDAVLLDKYYDEALIALGAASEVKLEATIIAVTSGVARYQVQAADADAVRIVAAFFDDRELLRSDLVQLEAFDHLWQATFGTPLTYLEEHEEPNLITIRLYPAPNATSPAAVMAPDPFGTDYPDGRLVVLTSDRMAAAPEWLDYPLALGILARDLQHSSAYRDPSMAEAVTKLGELARTLGGQP